MKKLNPLKFICMLNACNAGSLYKTTGALQLLASAALTAHLSGTIFKSVDGYGSVAVAHIGPVEEGCDLASTWPRSFPSSMFDFSSNSYIPVYFR